MANLTLEQVPRESEIIEVLYRISRPAQSHLDLTVSDDGAVRRLRFNGARVVQFQEQQPDVLQGLEVEDIRDQKLGDLVLWVSIASGAITFWAKTITELAEQKPEPRRPLPRETEDVPLVKPEEVRAWAASGLPATSFRYRTLGIGGALRGISVATAPHPEYTQAEGAKVRPHRPCT